MADEKAVNLQNYKCLCWALILLYPASVHADSYSFVPGWQSVWRHESSNSVCALSLRVPSYGQATFVASATTAPAFELQAHKDWHAPGPLMAVAFAPDWHPQAPWREELGTLSHIDGGGAVARGTLAKRMLFGLREGLHVELLAPAEFDRREDVSIHLTAKDLQPALEAFLKCAHTDIKVSWQEMSRTRLSYDVDEYALGDAGRAKLAALARYVLEDPTVNKLFVDGHTDASGSKNKNYTLSKRRADEVAAYLRTLGLKEQQIVVRYHGDSYPVADNSNALGKAQNRRTTVRLERTEIDRLAQN